MFGLGAGELILIAIVALLFVGPDKLPAAAKAIGRGIRDLRKQTSELTQTIEQDTHIGEAVRDLRSALRGEEPAPPRPRTPRPPPASPAQDTAPNGESASAAPPTVPADASAGDRGSDDRGDDDGPVARGAHAGVTTGTLRDRGGPTTASDKRDPGEPPASDSGDQSPPDSAHG